MPSRARRAIGIVRVSQVRGRAGDSFASPTEQADRIRAECARENLELLRIEEELDISGGKPLDERPGLGPAVRAIEAGEADVIVGAYFDRLFRGLEAQGEVLRRVESAGGQVLAVDVGRISAENAGKWLSWTIHGAMTEYFRRSTAERTREAQAVAIRRGVAPYGRVPAGYLKGEDGVYVPDPERAPVVAEAFEMRATGATVDEVWRHLDAAGIPMTYGGVYSLLSSRTVLGEIHFGKLEPNLTAHEAIVDRETWEAVQRARVPSGRKPKSERLLARLGVLRCATCGSRLAGSTATGSTSVGGGGGRKYPIYRCGEKTCPRPVSISCHLAESAVVEAVRAHLADLTSTTSNEEALSGAHVRLDRAQAELDAAIRTLSVVGEEPAAIERLGTLKRARDEARDAVERLRGLESALTLNAAADWDLLSVEARRGLIRHSVARALVRPGRGAGRVAIEFLP